MPFRCRSVLRSSHAVIALTCVCGACASDGFDAGAQPVWTGPGSPAPSLMGAGAAGASAGGATGAAAPGAAPVNTSVVPTSETPITPQLMPGGVGSGGATGENGGGQSGGVSAGGGAMVEGENAMGAAGAAAGGDGAAPRPSAACGRGDASPAFNLPNTLFSVPASYDGTTPLPVVIAFHAAGNPNTQLQGILGNTLDEDYIMLYPKSDGNGWSDGADAPKVDAIFDALDAIACYDQNRVFATGHSSGAQFIVQRLCAGETRWRAIAPVASSVYCSTWAPIPALVIHGIGDVEREAYGLDDGDGLKDIVPYRTSNGCQESFTEVPLDGCTSGGVQVSPGCREFDGCSERTLWCQHDDPQYGTSHHGVPCFGARAIQSFFDSYR